MKRRLVLAFSFLLSRHPKTHKMYLYVFVDRCEQVATPATVKLGGEVAAPFIVAADSAAIRFVKIRMFLRI
jgi:hypothetical protein